MNGVTSGLETITLGAFIDKYRRIKGVRLQTLCAQTGVSESTYNRFINNQADLRLGVLLNVMNFLRLDFNDLAPWLESEYLTLAQRKQGLDRLAGQILQGQRQFADLQEECNALGTLAQQTGDDGYLLVAEYGRLLLAKNKGDFGTATTVANQLFTALSAYTQWTTFEYELALPMISFLSFRRVKTLYAKFFAISADDFRDLGLQHEQLLNDEFLAFLVNALSTRLASNVITVVEWIEARHVSRLNTAFQLYVRFVGLIREVFAGQRETAEQHYQALQGAIDYFWQGAAASHRQVIAKLWQLVRDFPVLRKSPTPVAVATAYEPPVPEHAVGEILRHYQRSKKVSVDALTAQLYLSKSAFYRLVEGQAEVKSHIFFSAMNLLRLNTHDLKVWI